MQVPMEGYKEDTTEPAVAFTGIFFAHASYICRYSPLTLLNIAHTNRITFIQFHPTVSDLLLTVIGNSMTI